MTEEMTQIPLEVPSKNFRLLQRFTGWYDGFVQRNHKQPRFRQQPTHSDKDEDFIFLYIFFCHLFTFTSVRRRSVKVYGAWEVVRGLCFADVHPNKSELLTNKACK